MRPSKAVYSILRSIFGAWALTARRSRHGIPKRPPNICYLSISREWDRWISSFAERLDCYSPGTAKRAFRPWNPCSPPMSSIIGAAPNSTPRLTQRRLRARTRLPDGPFRNRLLQFQDRRRAVGRRSISNPLQRLLHIAPRLVGSVACVDYDSGAISAGLRRFRGHRNAAGICSLGKRPVRRRGQFVGGILVA